MGRFVLLTSAMLIAIGAPAAQSPWPERSRGPAPSAVEGVMVAIDDQLFEVAAPDSVRQVSGRQGVTLDNDTLTWLSKFSAWEAGVIPIEFADDVPAANRAAFMRICNTGWGGAALITCIPRTSQNGFLRITQNVRESTNAATCYSVIGQPRRLTRYELHLGPTCWADSTVYHELGHALGFVHEHQRSDRDTYVTIDLANVAANLQGNFTRITGLTDAMAPYDFLSIMHYRNTTFATNPASPTIVPKPGYTQFANTMGTAQAPSQSDRDAVNDLYMHYFRPLPSVQTTPVTRFDRTDFLDAMERLDAFYASRLGLARAQGLSVDGRPDFQGIATWIFDLYLGARSAGLNTDMSFGVVVAEITQSTEWRTQHPGWTSATHGAFTPSVRLDRSEFLDVLQRLDTFYSAPEGLRRPDGLSIAGGPDFLGIAAWVFDVYLNDRLQGASANAAWVRVMNAIQATDEWRSKH